MPGPPHSGLEAQAETAIGAKEPVGFDDEEKTTVDPGADDSFEEAKTVADPPENYRITQPQDVPRAADAGSETVDESTIQESAASVSGLPDAWLVVTLGPNKGHRFKLDKVVITIGRALENDIVLVDTSVSRRHLKIEFDGLHFYIQDLGSGNGTVVNGRDEDDRYQLSHRDAIELGRTMLAVDCPAVAKPVPKVSPPQPRLPSEPRPPRHEAFTPPPPTRSMRGEDPAHPAFDDVDEDARTIAGERPPGPAELPMGGGRPITARGGNLPSGKNRSMQRPEDLVMPRSPPGDVARPRRTIGSPAVPAPVATPRPSPVRLRTIPPPPPDPLAGFDDSEESQTRPAPPRSQPIPPLMARPPALHQSSDARVVYPSAPPQFIRPGPPSAITPRPVNHMGVVQPSARNGRARWALITVAVVIAGIGGVALAAVLGSDDREEPVAASSPDAAPQPSIDAAAGPQIAPLATGDAGAAASPDAGPAKAPDGDGATTLASTGPVVRGSLSTGAALPQTTWGTDEGVLDDAPEVKPLETPDGDTSDDEDDKKADDKKADDKKADSKKADGKKADDRRSDNRKSDDRKTDNRKSDDRKADNRKSDDREELAKLRRRAGNAYRDRNFGSAASAAGAAARLASGRTASRLRSDARNYEKLGRYLTQARKTSSSNPRVAMSSYIRARSVDRRVGGAHRRFISNQLLIVAPKAARKAMAADDLLSAKRAVDAARSAGDRVQTAGVMRSLENKARSLIAKGKRAQKSGDKAEAKAAFNEARRILPTSSSLIGEVKQLISGVD